jgi:hypothetical protein
MMSMSRKSNCYDNALVESVFSSQKNELVRHRQFQNQAEVRQAIVEYIEGFYNRQHMHQPLGYRSPEEFEKMTSESSSRCPLFPSHLKADPALCETRGVGLALNAEALACWCTICQQSGG